MSITQARFAIPLSLLDGLCALPAAAADITFFNTGNPDGKIATASRPDTAGFEIESADDFVLTHSTSITDATFTGLIPTGASPTKVVVEIYRVFPKDFRISETPAGRPCSQPRRCPHASIRRRMSNSPIATQPAA
jgi:hypothetical protein